MVLFIHSVASKQSKTHYSKGVASDCFVCEFLNDEYLNKMVTTPLQFFHMCKMMLHLSGIVYRVLVFFTTTGLILCVDM